MKRVTLLAAMGLLGTPAQAQQLALEDVLESTRRHHPRVAAALGYEDVARAELLAARGGFDPYLSAYGAIRTGGYYELRRLTVELRQPTPLFGAELWAGYRLGLGVNEDQSYPSYYDDQTLSGGEVRAGIRIPLWRDRDLDERRAQRERSGHMVRAAEERVALTTLELEQKATDAYMAWLAAGRLRSVAEALLQLAELRQRWVGERSDAGLVAPVDLLEAERAVLTRRRALVSATRAQQAATFVLALFHRDSQGAPRFADAEAAPVELALPPAPSESAAETLARVVVCHPQLREARARLDAARVDRELALAQYAPRVDIQGQVSRDFGAGPSAFSGTELEVGVVVSMPLGLRYPRGRLDAATAVVSVAAQDLRLREDQLGAQLADALSAYSAASESYALAQTLRGQTERLAAAERARFEAGATELFMVNVREQALAEASVGEIDALRDLWKACAAWRALSVCTSPASPGVRNRSDRATDQPIRPEPINRSTDRTDPTEPIRPEPIDRG